MSHHTELNNAMHDTLYYLLFFAIVAIIMIKFFVNNCLIL